MERNQRTTTVVILVFAAAACVVLAGLVAGLAWLNRLAPAVFRPEADQEARVEQTFTVGRAPGLDVDSFAGPVTVTAGPDGEMRVTATKKARSAGVTERMTVELRETENGLEVRTRRPAGAGNAYVDLVIIVPADTLVRVHTGSGAVAAHGLRRETRLETGSGSVRLSDLVGTAWIKTGSGALELEQVEGEIVAETGSGGISVRGAAGPIRVQTGSGGIDYEGVPAGDCQFETGSGHIKLHLPEDLQMAVDLSTGSGSVESGFTVSGQVERDRIKGTVGRGDQARIRAHTGSGSIDLATR